MQDVIVKTETIEKIVIEAIPKILTDCLTSSYNNPLKDAIEQELKDGASDIRNFIRELMHDILSKDELKMKVTDELLLQILQKGLKS